MLRLSSIIALALFSLLNVVVATPVGGHATEISCSADTVLSEWYIGEHNEVKVQELACPEAEATALRANALHKRQTNVCGAVCNTSCFTPSGGGPDPNECHVIADALRYASQNTGALFQIPSGTNNTVVMTYSSCKTFFVNQAFGAEAYCRTDWANVIDWVAPNCQSTQNAHGGLCVAADQSWFIQVAHS